jgi:hypothetical protein
MKGPWIVLALLSLVAVVSAGCANTGGDVGEYCEVTITPEKRLYNEEIRINVSMCFERECEPIEEGSEVEIRHYNSTGSKIKEKFETDSKGIVTYTPDMVNYYLVMACGKSILIYANTTCGDGICGGNENRSACPEDCGDCGDGICDTNEDLSCVDCAVCGDGVCSAGEQRSNCLKDCVFCGDGVCDYLENRSSCPDDCASGESDGCCDGESDGKCDPDCKMDEDPDCLPAEEENKTNETVSEPVAVREKDEKESILWIALIVLAIIAAIVSVKEILREKKISQEKKSPQKSQKQGEMQSPSA